VCHSVEVVTRVLIVGDRRGHRAFTAIWTVSLSCVPSTLPFHALALDLWNIRYPCLPTLMASVARHAILLDYTFYWSLSSCIGMLLNNGRFYCSQGPRLH